MSSTPVPPKQNLAQELGRIATTLTDDAQNAALRKCKELSFDTNKGMISLEETLINLSEARDILLDVVEKGKLVQLPLKLQNSLYEQTQRIAQQLTSLVNGTDEVINLVNSVEDITAAIWQYNLRNLSGEVLGLHNKMNQLKAQETLIRQVSREAAEFTSLQDSAKNHLNQISQIAAEATSLKASVQVAADGVTGALSKVSENEQKVSGIAVQVDQHGTTATQQLASIKQATADVEAIAKKTKELQTEIDTSRESLRDLVGKAQDLLSSTHKDAALQLSNTKTTTDELVSASQKAVADMTTKLEASITEQISTLKTGLDAANSSIGKTRVELEGQLATRLKEFSEVSQKQLADEDGAFKVQLTEWEKDGEESERIREAEYKKLVDNLDELEGRIRVSIERATGYSLFQSFQKRQLDIAAAKRFWGYALGCVVALALFASIFLIYHLPQAYNAAFYLKLSISVPLIYAIAFCNLQYSRERLLEEEYAFKSNISVSLEPYQKLVEKLIDKDRPEELSKYTAFIIDSVARVYTSPTGQVFETQEDKNSAEKLIKALGGFIEPIIKGLKR